MSTYLDNLIFFLGKRCQNNWSKKLAWELVKYNVTYIFKGKNEKISDDLKALLKPKLNVAFRLNGNLGSILIRLNFVKQFVSLCNRNEIEVTVFGHPKAVINQALCSHLDFIDHIKNYTDCKKEYWTDYDLLIDIDTFPTILHINKKMLEKKAPVYIPIIETWQKYKINHIKWYENFSDFRPQIYTLAIMQGKNCINNADIDNKLGLTKDFNYTIKCADTENITQKYKLKKRYITINRGSYTIAGQSEGTRVWPISHYNTLISLIKRKYPEIQIIQIGESPECILMEGIDLNLCGKTTLEELKILLRDAFLHIDGEGGMVHLRKAVGGGVSVVLFGSTPKEYFGYKDNINLNVQVCPESCCELHKEWLHKCLLSGGEAVCLQKLTPDKVFKEISSFIQKKYSPKIDNDTGGLYTGTYKFINDTSFSLDERWVDDFIKSHEIYAYFKEKIKIKDLFCMYFTKQKKWEKRPIGESNCMTFIHGNKQAYTQYNSFKQLYGKGDNFHNIEHFTSLIQTLEQKSYNHMFPIIVDGENIIMDGQHRACWLLNKFGLEYEIETVKIYGNWGE